MARRPVLAVTVWTTVAATLVSAAVGVTTLGPAPSGNGLAAPSLPVAGPTGAATGADPTSAGSSGSPGSPGSGRTSGPSGQAATAASATARIALAAPASTPKLSWQVAVSGQDKQAAAARIGAQSAKGAVRLVTLRDVDGRPQVVTETASGASAARLAMDAAADPEVLAMDVDTRSSVLGVGNDPGRSDQWALDALEAETVNGRHDASGVTVAVVDSGVQASHPDLAGAVLRGIDYVSTTGGDGTIDGHGHGTHVAGIIAAVADNGIGVAGFARGAKILPVRVLDDKGSGWDSAIASGIIWSADHGAKIINLSLGGDAADAVLESAVDYATNAGALVVAAAGNERADGSPTAYPAAYPNALAVAATDSSGASAWFSNIGSYVRIAAPGVSILSTYKGNSYASMSGTSMATPYVAAVAAVLAAASPGATPARLTTALTSTATDKGTPGRDTSYGYGIVNPAAALCTLGYCGTTGPGSTTSPTATPTTPTATPTTTAPATTTTTPTTTTTATTTSAAPRSRTSLALRALAGGVRYGSTVTVTGTISAGGRPLAGVPVTACLRRVNGTTCVSATSGATGALSWRLKATGSGTITAGYAGSPTTTPANSTAQRLTVWSVLALTTPRRGSLYLTMQPLLGQTITLQRLNRSRWGAVIQRTLPDCGAGCQGRVSVSSLPAGTYRFRVTTGSGLLAETFSSQVAVK